MSSNRISLFKSDVPESAVDNNGIQSESSQWKWGDGIEPLQETVDKYANKPTVNRSDLKVFPVMKI